MLTRSFEDNVKTIFIKYLAPFLFIAKAITATIIINYQLNFTKWDISLDPPSNIKNADLMVAKNVLHKQRNLSKALKNMSSAIKDNGFILIEEITSNFPVGFSSEQLWEEPLEIDDDRSCYCFCNEQKWCQIFDENGFDIIFKRSSQHLSTLFLIRPKLVSRA
jgi:hypothetical protein